MAPQEQVMALEVPDRVECPEGHERTGDDPHRPDLQVEQLRVGRDPADEDKNMQLTSVCQ